MTKYLEIGQIVNTFGIKGMVKICRSFKLGKDDAAQRLMKELKISKEEAEEGVEMYWE